MLLAQGGGKGLDWRGQGHGAESCLAHPGDIHAVYQIVSTAHQQAGHQRQGHLHQQFSHGHNAHLVFRHVQFLLLNLFLPVVTIPYPDGVFHIISAWFGAYATLRAKMWRNF